MVSWFHSRAKVAIVCSVLLTILLLSANKAHAYTSPNTQEDVARYTGAYGMEPGALLFVRRANRWSFEPPSTLLSSRLFLVDEHGGTCTLVPAGEKSFTVSPTDASNDPRIKVHFIESQDGHIVALRWVAHGLADRVLPRFSGYREEEVTFEGPSGTLGGRLLLPSTHVPAPAVILIAGAGPTDRHQEYFVVADVFASQGFATLIYDKRGTGISSGNWRIASPSDLADDALAGFRFLQTRSEIDSGRIGLYGLSEGGLVVGIAASRNPDVAFLIVVSAPGVSRSTWERRWVQNELRAAALSHHEIGDALRFVALEDRFVRGKVDWSMRAGQHGNSAGFLIRGWEFSMRDRRTTGHGPGDDFIMT